jgi:hypothetical protein
MRKLTQQSGLLQTIYQEFISLLEVETLLPAGWSSSSYFVLKKEM